MHVPHHSAKKSQEASCLHAKKALVQLSLWWSTVGLCTVHACIITFFYSFIKQDKGMLLKNSSYAYWDNLDGEVQSLI